jgi:hypothetical protein
MVIRHPIISVPHSGTRSLADYLGKQRFYHFHQLAINPELDVAGTVHIPVRDPLEHAVSWACFEGSLGHKRTSRAMQDVQHSFFAQVEFMLDFIRDWKAYRLYKMEDLPRVAGFGPKADAPIRKMLKNRNYMELSRELPELFEFLAEKRIRGFYARYYPFYGGDTLFEMAGEPAGPSPDSDASI